MGQFVFHVDKCPVRATYFIFIVQYSLSHDLNPSIPIWNKPFNYSTPYKVWGFQSEDLLIWNLDLNPSVLQILTQEMLFVKKSY